MTSKFENLIMLICFFFSQIVMVQTYYSNCHIISDLEEASLSADISTWQIQNNSGWNQVFTCGPYKMLGGLSIENPTIEKTYTGLCNHDMIYLELDLLIVDSINKEDSIRLYVDGNSKLNVTGGDLFTRTNNDICGTNSSETLIRIIAKIQHSTSSLTLKFDWEADQGIDNEGYGLSKIIVHMKQTNGPEPEAFYSRTDFNIIPSLTPLTCPIGQYKSGGSCQPCHSLCSECIDKDQESNCIRCQNNYFLNWNNNCFLGCHPFFTKITTPVPICHFPCPNPTDFVYKRGQCNATCHNLFEKESFDGRKACNYKCSAGEYLYQDKICRPFCNHPTNQEKSVYNDDLCISPCSDINNEYLYVDQHCSTECPSFAFKEKSEHGLKYCNYRCSNPNDFIYDNQQCSSTCPTLFEEKTFHTKKWCHYKCNAGEYLYQDQICRDRCPAPFIIENSAFNYQSCLSPCQAHEYHYQNNSCLLTCPTNSFTIKNQFGFKFCIYKCSNLDHYLYDDESCDAQCDDYEHEVYINKIEKLCKTCKKPKIVDKGQCVNPPDLFNLKTIINSVAISTGPSLMLRADPAIMWGILSIMQILYYLLFMNVRYPQNFKQFLKLFSAGRLEFIPDILGDALKNRELESPKNFYENEFSGFFLQSVGSMLTSFIMILLFYGISKFILICYGRRRQDALLSRIFKYFQNQYEWSGILRLQIGGYLEFSFGAFLQIMVLNFSDFIYALSASLSILVVIFNLFFPFFVLYLIKRKVSCNSELSSQYQALSDDYDINRTTPKYFLVFVLVEKLLLVLSIVFLYEAPILQNIFPWITRTLLLILLFKHRPHVNSFMNFSESMTELALFVIHSIIFVLSLEKEKKISISHEIRDLMGLLMISAALLTLGIQLFLIIREQISTIRFLVRWVYQRIKNKDGNRSLKIKQKKIRSFHQKLNSHKFKKEAIDGDLRKINKKKRIGRRKKEDKNRVATLGIKL